MTPKDMLTGLTLAALVAASFSTVALADTGKGPRGAGMFDFDAMDANADGKVTKDEIAAYHAARIAALDTNKDGNLSEAELIAGHEARRAERLAKRMDRMMTRMDANKDGVLSLAEMAPPADRSDKMFARVDTDGDGAISKAEADAARDKMEQRRDRHGKKRGHDN
ncbi:EF-hand domain-containing protein [Pseudorhodobacter sp.]|uniref:EF-hand domain-containing protein n=1 Tax=Pseudorhodobacter sp. TaxID=1934400 RepID=UPI002649DE9E|nr:EF-hand domain-containing protein [Pseudorhodobacter sp.]MDN5787371.1 EF-hand domain-containing protein [Pseudorhodobacter sp.]